MSSALFVSSFAFITFLAGCGNLMSSSSSTDTTPNDGIPVLMHLTTHEMPMGTHRPEILVSGDTLFLLVVEHHGDIRHMGYRFDATEPSAIDFSDTSDSFVVSTAGDYGMGADHRAAIMNDEIVVVVQTLSISDLTHPVSGPMEQYADSQTLLLARFELDGTEILTDEILTSTDFEQDTFPDMSVLPQDGVLLVSTGSGADFRIREVDMEANILNTYEINLDRFGTIGQCLVYGDQSEVMVFADTAAPEADITIAVLDEGLSVADQVVLEDQDLDETFPTGVLLNNGYYFVGYRARSAGGDPSVELNPNSPWLRILDTDLSIVDEIRVSDTFGAIHATMVVVGDRLFYAWSRSHEDDHGGEQTVPQVVVEEYLLSFE